MDGPIMGGYAVAERQDKREYELRYRITLRQEPVPKVFLDELRCRNGNLNITCCREESHESL